MKENILQFIYVLLGITFVILVLNNESKIGTYVPFGNKMLLDTTNGNVYIPTEGKNTRYTWKKYFSFNKAEMQDELSKINKEIKDINILLKSDISKKQKEINETLKMILEIDAKTIQNKLDSFQ